MQSPELLDAARERDARDPLAEFRQAFLISDQELVYLKGNSLGRMPRRAAELLAGDLAHQWGERLVRGWNEGWYTLSQRIAAKLARVIGAKPHEVLLCDSTSVNLFKLTHAALRARPGRYEVLSDAANFPSDLYVMQAAADQLGGRLRVVGSEEAVDPAVSEVREALSEDTALLSLSHVLFKSGGVHPMHALTDAAHAVGALALWDLSHSAGTIPVEFCNSQADLAVGCTYKYLCGGPGAPAYLVVREDLIQSMHTPIPGWFGHAEPFAFELESRPADGIARFFAGTPPILSLAATEPGIDLLLEAGLPAVYAKAEHLTACFLALYRRVLADLGLVLKTPREHGAHVTLGHPEAYRISRALIEQENVVVDFRAPDNLRLGFAPLTTRFEDTARAVLAIERVLKTRSYEQVSAQLPSVT